MEKKQNHKKVKSFYVIRGDNGRFKPYDVIPYFVSVYNDRKPKDRPKTFEEFKEFVEKESMYMFWARCEYEIVLNSWPPSKEEQGYKIDIHEQIMMNHSLVTEVLMNVLKK